MEEWEILRQTTAHSLTAALQAWSKAPISVKTMAGPYMEGILKTLQAMNEEIKQLQDIQK